MRRVYRSFRDPTLGLPPVTDVDASSSQLSLRKKSKNKPQICPNESSESRCIPSMRLPWKQRGDRVKEVSDSQPPARRTSRKLKKRNRRHQPASRLPVRVVDVEEERPSTPFYTTETNIQDNRTEELQLLRKLSPIDEGDETTDAARSLRSITRSIHQPINLYPPSSNTQLANDHATSQNLSLSTPHLTAHHARSDSESSDLRSGLSDSSTGHTSSHGELGRVNSTHRVKRKPVPRLPLPDDLISLIDVKVEEEIDTIEPLCDITLDTDTPPTQAFTYTKRPYSPLFAPRSRTQSSPSFFSRITELADKGPPICSRRFSYPPPPIAKPSMPSRRTASVRLSPQEVVRRNAEASTSSNEAETDLRPSVLDDFWYRLEGNHGGVKVRRQHEGRKPVPSLLRNSIVEDDSVDFVQGTNSDENPSRSVSSTIRYLDKGTDATNTGSWSELPNAHPVQGRLDYFASYALSSIPTTAPAVDDVSHTQNFDHIEPPGIESSRFVEDFGDFSPTALAVAVDQKLMYLNVGGSLSTLDLTGTPEENPEPVAEVLSPKCPEDDGDDEFDSLHRTMKTVERGLCQDIEWSSLRPSTSGTNEVSDVPRDTPDEPDASARIPGITISPPSPPSPTIPPIPPRSPLRHRRTPSIESDNETNELDMMRHKVNVLERKFSEVKVALGVQQDITVAVEREAQTVAVIVADLRKVNEDKDREIASLKAELAKLRRINSDFIRAVKEAGMANCALQDENDSLRIQRESYASMHGRNFTERMTNTAISVSPASKISSRSSTPPPPLMPSWTNVYKTPPRTPSKKLIVHVPSDAERLADDTLQSESRAQVPSDRTDGYALLTPEATPIRIRRRSASLDLRADAQHAEPRVRFAAMRPDKNSPNNLNCSTNDDEEYDSDETTAYEHNGVGRNDKRP